MVATWGVPHTTSDSLISSSLWGFSILLLLWSWSTSLPLEFKVPCMLSSIMINRHWRRSQDQWEGGWYHYCIQYFPINLQHFFILSLSFSSKKVEQRCQNNAQSICEKIQCANQSLPIEFGFPHCTFIETILKLIELLSKGFYSRQGCIWLMTLQTQQRVWNAMWHRLPLYRHVRHN